MIVHNSKIHIKKGKNLILVPFGDIQSESEYDRLSGLINWLDRRINEGNEVRIFGTGDYFESPSPSDRAALRSAKGGYGLYDEANEDIEQIYIKKAMHVVDILKPVRKNILGFLEGHHGYDLSNPDLPRDTNRLIAHELGTEYWGTSALVVLNIDGKIFRIVATHGYGSGRTPGARITKRHRMREVYLNANWYVMAHDNEKSVYVTEVMTEDGYLKQYYTGSGSFQRSYNIGNPKGTYAEKQMLPPSALGVVICTIGKHDDGTLDYHIST